MKRHSGNRWRAHTRSLRLTFAFQNGQRNVQRAVRERAATALLKTPEPRGSAALQAALRWLRDQIDFDEGDAGGVVGAGDVDGVGAGFELDEKGGVFAGVGESGETDLRR